MTDPTDPFKETREAQPVVECEVQGESIPMLLRHKDVREAARDWKTFSSDAPFRVPIPSEESVRSVRQLPIETDPPDHTAYREIIEPFFLRPRETEMREKIAALIHELLEEALMRDSVEVVGEFALPLQSRALTYLLGVPEAEAEEWMSWGVNVLKDTELSAEKGARLDAYIHRKLDAAAAAPGDDLFSVLTQARFHGRPLTREEMVGFANLVFAGGRDTVIYSVTSILAYLGGHREAFDQLRGSPSLVNSAMEEFFRYISPLTHLGRVCPRDTGIHGRTVAAGERVALCWASANRDATAFAAPDRLQLDRKPNPHVAFGSGPHTCIGAMHARVIVRALLQALCAHVSTMSMIEQQPNTERIGHFQRQIGHDRLVMKLVR